MNVSRQWPSPYRTSRQTPPGSAPVIVDLAGWTGLPRSRKPFQSNHLCCCQVLREFDNFGPVGAKKKYVLYMCINMSLKVKQNYTWLTRLSTKELPLIGLFCRFFLKMWVILGIPINSVNSLSSNYYKKSSKVSREKKETDIFHFH